MGGSFIPSKSKRKDLRYRKRQRFSRATISIPDLIISKEEESWMKALEQKVGFWNYERTLFKIRRSTKVTKIRVQPYRSRIPRDLLISDIKAQFEGGCTVKPVIWGYKKRWTFDVSLYKPMAIWELKKRIGIAIEKYL